jgi:hypothetical protein
MSIEITDWLRRLRLEQYAPAFHDNAIDAEILRELTADDLKDLGVNPVGHRRKLLAATAALQPPSAPIASSASLQPGPDAGEAYARARRLSEAVPRPNALLFALWGQWVYHVCRADLALAQQLAAEIRERGEARRPGVRLDNKPLPWFRHPVVVSMRR